jgi:hypothetical protein
MNLDKIQRIQGLDRMSEKERHVRVLEVLVL